MSSKRMQAIKAGRNESRREGKRERERGGQKGYSIREGGHRGEDTEGESDTGIEIALGWGLQQTDSQIIIQSLKLISDLFLFHCTMSISRWLVGDRGTRFCMYVLSSDSRSIQLSRSPALVNSWTKTRTHQRTCTSEVDDPFQ